VLRGGLELALSATGDTAEVERSLRAALREAERLARLADDLLVLARERAGSLVVRDELVDLFELAATEPRRAATGRARRMTKISIVNWVPAAILSSPAHRALSRKRLVLSFTGRRSGTHYATPVNYVQRGTELLITTDSRWWRPMRNISAKSGGKGLGLGCPCRWAIMSR
jgi:signal transduction histidine kinase